MSNKITEKLEVFLQNLRCENRGRETLVHLESSRIESERLRKLQDGYQQVLSNMEPSDRTVLEAYTEQLLQVAFTEQQESYLQGLLDAFQILCGLGILSTNKNVEKIIAELKNGSPE